ncbi:pyrroline-5-carboxylate reductase [Propionibacterium sp. NM47_B9-13]|uniref:Pyrroline-5-carboxylate reductase n=2 Tax=Cutibacterium modestum TaxID=2559073 RepID=A0AAD1NUR5_9ACTN|nr:pyrroline-5-carboxylate reductase [Cutibacterium modestum]MCP2375816.1 pyrroline-5-carboxylate reductase [Cutibacterium modestum 28N]MCP2380518.1 pyrroline-5-carboxylate reductase [Cutibacterium modestum 30N]TGY28693.1 pyrroline-5-carboxylate reductase [Propionibacterium sp. NM47_B9-13]AOH45344.1 pyrroline-5-carboxylate reductase [Cutibacterium modestum]EFS73348.1 pyrroline-5-carboxylate reductase [Cutibacterium modestum HL037PA2]
MSGKIAVLGCGTMAGALVGGLIDAGTVKAEDVVATARSASHRDEITKTLGVTTSGDNTAAARDADLVILGVKPYAAVEVLGKVSGVLKADATVVSIAAGVTTEKLLRAWQGEVVRVMPNTPVQVGKGAFIVSPAPGAEKAATKVGDLLESVGVVVTVPEKLHDAATAVSGSGPAYVFLVAEAMIDAAVAMGLPRNQASQLTVATLAGSAELLTKGEHPAVLRSTVTSPGGTTAAALAALEAGGLRSTFATAMTACRDRAADLS